jgi:hypothetical protein
VCPWRCGDRINIFLPLILAYSLTVHVTWDGASSAAIEIIPIVIEVAKRSEINISGAGR